MTEVIAIRTARPADLAAVDALLARSYPAQLSADYPPSVMVTAVPLIARARPELMGSGHYFLAVNAEGGVVGAAGVTSASGRVAVGEIRHVVTDHRLTRRGIGRALMLHVFDHARGLGLRRLDCLSTRTAVPYYRALGFDLLGPAEITLAPGIVLPVLRLSRELQ
jgi:N-acetylglutamate synthase-like GNAT family acetyltransferase